MKEEKIYKTRDFKELNILELRLIFESLKAYKYVMAQNLTEFYRKSLIPGWDYDFYAEHVQKKNLLWPDENEDFFSEIVRAINTRKEEEIK